MTFFKGSRYANVGEVETTDALGRTVRYKRTRFIDQPPSFGTHLVVEGDRLDLLAYSAYGDVEQWWTIADLNLAMRPSDVIDEPGTVIQMPTGQS